VPVPIESLSHEIDVNEPYDRTTATASGSAS